MPKKLSPEDELTLRQLTERMLITIRFVESVQDFPSAGELRGIVQDAAAKGDLRTIRLLSRDLREMAVTLAPHERDGLEAILQQRLGVDANAERAELRRQVAKSMQRGTIASEKERRRLEDYVEMLEATAGDPAEIECIRQFLRSN